MVRASTSHVFAKDGAGGGLPLGLGGSDRRRVSEAVNYLLFAALATEQAVIQCNVWVQNPIS